MGSVVEYRCAGCTFSTGHLSLGWGKAGRASFWGGLALCGTCKALRVVNLSDKRPDGRDPRCPECQGMLKLFEGMVEQIRCPHCGAPMRHTTVGSWS